MAGSDTVRRLNKKEAVHKNAPSPPAYTGKQHSWAVSYWTRVNGPLLSLAPTVAILTFTILFNKSLTGQQFYTWLNANYTNYEINAWWGFAITSLVYWAAGLIYMAMDMWEPLRTRVFKWKLQPEVRVTWADYRKVCYIVAKNQLLVALPLLLATSYVSPLKTDLPLPGAWRTIFTYVFCMLVEEAGFFYVHRAMHSPKYYKRYHKLHHQYTAPVALASTYCSMTEHILSNTTPVMLGVVAARSHWSLFVMFFCSLELGTLATHSGYNFPGNFNALQHDWHHYAYTENFGPTGLLDRVYGSNSGFKAWLAELRRRDQGSPTGQLNGTSSDLVSKAREELAQLESQAAGKRLM